MLNEPIPLQPLHNAAQIPRYAYPGDGGCDLCATESLVLRPFERALVSTGIALAIPIGYAGFIVPRSGLAIKHGISVINAPGLIDSNYRGEIKVPLINLDPQSAFTIQAGDRIAQLVIASVEHASFAIHENLDVTERGCGGFGSSGVSSH